MRRKVTRRVVTITSAPVITTAVSADGSLQTRWRTCPVSSRDKYPGWSPYNYTMNNPLRFVDTDGRYVREGTSFIFMSEMDFKFNLFIWDAIGVAPTRNETLFPNKTREVAADYLLSAILILPKAVEFSLNAISAMTLIGEAQDKYFQWQAEQEVLTEIQNGISSLSEYFNPQCLNELDKKSNNSRYSRGSVLNLDPRYVRGEKNRKGLKNAPEAWNINRIETRLGMEIDTKYRRKKDKQFFKSHNDKYDVENGEI